ncbi:hypothetical protein SDC9_188247 [bioreactor metagenome]|uniref:Uncharacterized protein n=1 Tax=bioreactor metagenome TaxID=1076179 RepID=A0A645HNW5_9ZZZZ
MDDLHLRRRQVQVVHQVRGGRRADGQDAPRRPRAGPQQSALQPGEPTGDVLGEAERDQVVDRQRHRHRRDRRAEIGRTVHHVGAQPGRDEPDDLLPECPAEPARGCDP